MDTETVAAASRRWTISRVACVREGEDFLVLPTDEPLGQPLRLTGSSALCWEHLRTFSAGATAIDIAHSLPKLVSVDDTATHHAMVSGIVSFLETLRMAGVVELVSD